jgi:glycosyltransferase involved in cell wall biosynthesis
MSKKIYILLATYNADSYLHEQIDSLLRQTYKDWILWVHDDNSKDNTVNIIKEYMLEHPLKIKFLEDEISTAGAKENFTYLLNSIDDDYAYLMFCDQDDIWLENKIEFTLSKMKEVESSNQSQPVLIHTDLKVVDENLSTISESFFIYQKINPEWSKDFDISLVQNSITGCTMMINKKAKEISLPIGSNAIMHDWWILLRVLQNNGVVEFTEDSTMLYRQHSLNDVGAKGFSYFGLAKKITSLKKYYLMSKDLGLKLSIIEIAYIKIKRFLWY